MIITITNGKGGTGKTTLNIFLALWLSRHNFKTLLIDLDPNCSASEALGKILCDQKAGGGYFTINCQPDPYLPPLEQEESLMSFIAIPEDGKLLVSTPPHPEYYEYTL